MRCSSVWFVEPGDAAAEAAFATAVVAPPMAAAPADPPPSADAAAGADLEDLSAWGLADDAASNTSQTSAEPAGDPFSMDSMMGDMQAAIPVTDGPPLVPFEDWQGAMGELPPAPEDDSPGLHRPRPGVLRRARKLRPPSMTTVILVLTAIIVGILGWRADVVRDMPQTASLFAAIGLPVNLRGLALEDVKATKELQDGVPVLVLEGRIVNISRLMLEVPRIRFALSNAAGHEVYNWTALPSRPILAPNAEERFRTRLASPPAEGRAIVVRFFTHRDAVEAFR